MGENRWWHPSQDDLHWDDTLPDTIELSPIIRLSSRCGATASGNVAWQYTKFCPRLLDRLAAWQQEFDDNFRWDTGWRSTEIRDHWAGEAANWRRMCAQSSVRGLN